MDHYCLNCMHNIAEATGICPVCGSRIHVENNPHQLEAGTMLRGRYLVGRVLGEGGFGITYIGRDTVFDDIVAIKEYYPNGMITRNSSVSTTVTITGKDGSENYAHGMDKFLDEARVLHKFRDENGIVGVNDFFRENGTAYIVMEYLNGTTLKNKIQKDGPMTADELLPLMRPVIKALDDVHRGGIVHRDISPDNIMLMPDGTLRLLDFGAARAVTGDRSLSVMLKPGYAPVEQYRSRGIQGPWTDIYALCATLYFCLTGAAPADSIERVIEDEVEPPSAKGAKITPEQEAALMKGMAVQSEERYRSLSELEKDLYSSAKDNEKTQDIIPDGDSEEPPENEPEKKKHRFWPAAVIAAVLVLVLGAFFAFRGKTASAVTGTKNGTGAETETADLSDMTHVTLSSDMSVSDYNESIAVLEERLQAFAGDQYILQKDEKGGGELYIPKADFGQEEPQYMLEGLLLSDNFLYIMTEGSYTRGEDALTITPESIASAEVLTGAVQGLDQEHYGVTQEEYKYIRFTFTDDFLKANGETIRQYGTDGVLCTDLSSGGYCYWRIAPDADETTFYVLLADGDFGNEAELLVWNMTHDPMPVAFNYLEELQVEWFEADGSGAQCGADDFSCPAATAVFQLYADDYTEGEQLDDRNALCERLETLGVPYAIGRVQDTEYPEYAVRIPYENAGYPIFAAIGSRTYSSKLYYGLKSIEIEPETMEITAGSDGNYRIELTFSDYSKEGAFLKFAEQLPTDGSGYLYWYVDDYPYCALKLSEPVEENKLTFDMLCFPENVPITEDNLWAAELLKTVCFGAQPNSGFYLEEIRCTDTDGTALSAVDMGMNYTGAWQSAADTIRGIYSDARITITDGSFMKVRLDLPVCDTLPLTAVSLTEKIYNALDFENLPLQSLGFYLIDEDNSTQERARIFFYKYGGYSDGEGYVYSTGIFARNGRLEPYADEFLKQLQASELFSATCRVNIPEAQSEYWTYSWDTEWTIETVQIQY